MKFTVQQIADLLKGTVHGPGEIEINQLAKIDDPQAGTGSICFLANPKYENYLYSTRASAVIIQEDFQPRQAVHPALILVSDPYSAFTQLLEEYNRLVNQYQHAHKIGIESPVCMGQNVQLGREVYVGAFAYIGNDCQLGDGVKIYPHCYIGDKVKIGAGTIVFPGVKIYENTQIGQYCTLHAGAVIGSEGFGFAPQADGSYKNIPQLGNVILQDHVSIGANTTIDRATIGSTIIEHGVKLDNLIQIGHNVVIGEHTVMAAQTGVAGSSKIGKRCVIAGQVGIANSLQIADQVVIGAKAGINRNLKQEKTTVIGAPAMDYKTFMKASVIFRKLPELQRRVELLEEKTLNLPPQ
ncbi:MAG: UDP-3-O-(3-hydroxymyristoyl)glucosamine N-acyltransferase [Microscillaceae bacterium]|nr:UDP-3-O-(3-hydroxymyristoyl)glucosamine N-acyltransferase [Microscillaceae bacterium]